MDRLGTGHNSGLETPSCGVTHHIPRCAAVDRDTDRVVAEKNIEVRGLPGLNTVGNCVRGRCIVNGLPSRSYALRVRVGVRTILDNVNNLTCFTMYRRSLSGR